ncbi:MAG TPA: YceI family protein [Candidatus Nitrosocosmicus sp.]
MERQTYQVDIENSHLIWTGRRVTGAHQGTIQLANSKLDLIDGVIDSGTFRFDISTIKVTDIVDPDINEQLRLHLLSDDFFSAEHYPIAEFYITSALPDGEGNYNIEGNLTIKGITKPLMFDVSIEINKDSLKANAKIIIDRTDYGIRFRSNKFFENLGNLLIYDDFTVDFELVALLVKIVKVEDLDLSNII